MASKQRIILGVTGSIAAYRSADIIRGLMEKGLRVTAVMTSSAEHFMTPLTLSGLSGEPVYGAMFDNESDQSRMKHIELAKEADAVVIAPATANIIGRLAAGMANDLLSCIVLGTKAPVVIAPAMNTQMYRNPIVQENCEKLKKYGMKFVDPIKGKLACGDHGDGHIADQQTIIKAVLKVLM